MGKKSLEVFEIFKPPAHFWNIKNPSQLSNCPLKTQVKEFGNIYNILH